MLFVQVLEQLDAAKPAVLLAALFLVGLILAFLKFTLRPPQEPDVFIDPITRKYGLQAHSDAGAAAEHREKDA